MSKSRNKTILVVENNSEFREALARGLRAHGFEVVTEVSGEEAFLTLRDWSRPVDWMYARAALPGLIDGWLLADAYHDSHPDRAVVLSGPETRTSRSGDIVLKQPSPQTVIDHFQSLAEAPSGTRGHGNAHLAEARQASCRSRRPSRWKMPSRVTSASGMSTAPITMRSPRQSEQRAS
jgi:CheY-like chemotaxis protein